MTRLTPLMAARCIWSTAVVGAMLLMPSVALGQTTTRGETYAITRAKGPIVIDGNLGD